MIPTDYDVVIELRSGLHKHMKASVRASVVSEVSRIIAEFFAKQDSQIFDEHAHNEFFRFLDHESPDEEIPLVWVLRLRLPNPIAPSLLRGDNLCLQVSIKDETNLLVWQFEVRIALR